MPWALFVFKPMIHTEPLDTIRATAQQTYTTTLPSGTVVTIEATATMGDLMVSALLMSVIFLVLCWSLYFIATRIAYSPRQDAQQVVVVNEAKE